MSEEFKRLGRLIAVHPVAPAYVQRAVFIAVLSFVFFLAMMIAFYIRQSLGYFLLATAFLFVYLITMFSWFNQRKAAVKVFEGGIEYRSYSLEWSDIESINEDKAVIIKTVHGKAIQLPSIIAEPAELVRNIRFHLPKA